MQGAREIIEAFLPAWSGEVEPDSLRDWLGRRTRARYFHATYGRAPGSTTPPPDPEREHDGLEWAGVLKSVLSAGSGPLTVVELGAGYGPFVCGAALAARKIGARHVRLIAVEADATHFEWLREHLRDNGIDPAAHRLIRAAVGAHDGVVRFPRLADPALEWGPRAVFDGVLRWPWRWTRRGRKAARGYVAVKCISVASVLADVKRVDVMHCDIQGAEYEALGAGRDVLNAKVRRLVIGTHGRDIEQALRGLLSANGWRLEGDKSCVLEWGADGATRLILDGVQVWGNARFVEARRAA